jgi:ABC-type antimicrobial peptide transport system permease subunit
MNAMAIFLMSFIIVGVLPLVFRSKGASVFMMLCVGKALMEISANEVARVARTVLNSSLPVDDIAKVFIMLLPAVLALFVTKKAAKKKYPYHIVPSVVGGLLAGFWSVSVLSKPDDFEHSTTFNYVQANIMIILAVGIVSTLFLFFMERPKPVKPEETGHQKK